MRSCPIATALVATLAWSSCARDERPIPNPVILESVVLEDQIRLCRMDGRGPENCRTTQREFLAGREHVHLTIPVQHATFTSRVRVEWRGPDGVVVSRGLVDVCPFPYAPRLEIGISSMADGVPARAGGVERSGLLPERIRSGGPGGRGVRGHLPDRGRGGDLS